MQIEYCASCATRICDSDFAQANAFRIENEPYCRACKEKLNALPQASAPTIAPKRKTSSARLKAMRKTPESGKALTPTRGAKPVHRRPSHIKRLHKHAETTWFLTALAVVSALAVVCCLWLSH